MDDQVQRSGGESRREKWRRVVRHANKWIKKTRRVTRKRYEKREGIAGGRVGNEPYLRRFIVTPDGGVITGTHLLGMHACADWLRLPSRASQFVLPQTVKTRLRTSLWTRAFLSGDGFDSELQLTFGNLVLFPILKILLFCVQLSRSALLLLLLCFVLFWCALFS